MIGPGLDNACRTPNKFVAEPAESIDMDHFCEGERDIKALSSAMVRAENIGLSSRYALPALQLDGECRATKNVDATKETRAKTENLVREAADPARYPELHVYRETLEHLAEHSMDQPNLQAFKSSMQVFETRMQAVEGQYWLNDGNRVDAHTHAVEEIENTYKQLGRLLTNTGDTAVGVTQGQRVELAKQILGNAAAPTAIDQGQHSTCNVNTVEVRAFTRNPSDAARVIISSAMGGYFATKDNHVVTIDKGSLQPDDEAKQFPAPDGARNYASQIFQVAAINSYYQPETNGKIHYCVEKADATANPPVAGGDYLMDYSANPPRRMTTPNIIGKVGVWLSGKPDEYANTPNMSADRIKIAGERITGDKSDWIITRRNTDSEESLRQRLSDARKHGNLPIVVEVHTCNEPFYTDSGAGSAGGSGGWHVVTVQDYIPGSPAKAEIDNSWGSQADRCTPGSALSMHDLFAAIQDPSKSIDLLRSDINWNRDNNIICEYKEVDLVRMKQQAGEYSGDQYEQAIGNRLVHLHKHIVDKSATADDVRMANDKLFSLIYNLPDGKSFELRNEQLKLGLVNINEFALYVLYDINRLSVDHKASVQSGSNDEAAKLRWGATVKELQKSLDVMDPEVRNLVAKAMAKNRMLEDQ